MNVSAAIKVLLNMKGKKQGSLAGVLGVGSVQAVSNKFRLGRWSASDLIKIADFTGSKLAFILPNGERVVLDSAGPTHGVSAEAVGGGVTHTTIREEEKDS